jgi:hypothetical protein
MKKQKRKTESELPTWLIKATRKKHKQSSGKIKE